MKRSRLAKAITLVLILLAYVGCGAVAFSEPVADSNGGASPYVLWDPAQPVPTATEAPLVVGEESEQWWR